MSDAQYASFTHGGLSLPFDPASVNTLLRDADPAIYYALEFFTACLNRLIGSRLVAEAAIVGATEIQFAVGSSIPLDPGPHLAENQLRFPLLAVYRTKAQTAQLTVEWQTDVSEWRIDYVLPTLTAGQAERITPILRAVAKTLQDRTEQAIDPAYPTDGERIWKLAGITEIKFVSESYGTWEAGGDLVFPCVTCNLQVTERGQSYLANFNELLGSTNSVALAISGDADINDVAVTDCTHT